MKKNILLFLVVLLLNGCGAKQFSFDTLFQKHSSKQELINKAEGGDIDAMVLLHTYYSFPETKEGFDYYNKWYEIVIKSDKSEDILAFAEIFEQYKEMFINGDKKYIKLLELVQNSQKANFALLKYYKQHYGEFYKKQIAFYEKKILSTASYQDLLELYDIYHNAKYSYNSSTKKKDTIQKILKEKNYYIPKIYKLKSIYLKKGEKGISAVLDEIYNANNPQDIVQTANYLKKWYLNEQAIRFYEKAITFYPNDAVLYYKLGMLYYSYGYNDKHLMIKNLKKAVILGSDEAAMELLYNTTKDEEFMDEYFFVKRKLQKTTNGQKIYAKYLNETKQKYQANQIFNHLAMQGDRASIIELASKISTKYYGKTFEDSKLAKKWYKYILDSKDAILLIEFLGYTQDKRYATQELYVDIYNSLMKIEDKDKNIVAIKKLSQRGVYRNEFLTKFQEVAASLGDVESSFVLAKSNISIKNEQNVQYAIEKYQTLIDRGDIKAMKELGEFYLLKYLKHYNKKKAIFYYKKAADLGDSEAIKKVSELYLCKYYGCQGNTQDKKALYYLKKLLDMKDKHAAYDIGSIYEQGRDGIVRDMKKATKYYELSAELGNEYAYSTLGWLYSISKYKNIRDYSKAFQYISTCIKKYPKSGACNNMMGILYEKGYGATKDFAKAVSYYEKIADNYAYGAENLARAYYEHKNIPMAIKYYKKANTKAAKEMLLKLEGSKK